MYFLIERFVISEHITTYLHVEFGLRLNGEHTRTGSTWNSCDGAFKK